MRAIYLAVALAMDAFALSLALGSIKNDKNNKLFGLKAALIFGFFQGLLFYLGCVLGLFIKAYIINILKYVSFVILLLVSLNMFKEFIKGEEVEEMGDGGLINIGFLVSIDAFITGVASVYFEFNLLYIVSLISLITFALSLFGFFLAVKLKKINFIEKYSLLLSSLILFYLAIKIII